MKIFIKISLIFFVLNLLVSSTILKRFEFWDKVGTRKVFKKILNLFLIFKKIY